MSAYRLWRFLTGLVIAYRVHETVLLIQKDVMNHRQAAMWLYRTLLALGIVHRVVVIAVVAYLSFRFTAVRHSRNEMAQRMWHDRACPSSSDPLYLERALDWRSSCMDHDAPPYSSEALKELWPDMIEPLLRAWPWLDDSHVFNIDPTWSIASWNSRLFWFGGAEASQLLGESNAILVQIGLAVVHLVVVVLISWILKALWRFLCLIYVNLCLRWRAARIPKEPPRVFSPDDYRPMWPRQLEDLLDPIDSAQHWLLPSDTVQLDADTARASLQRRRGRRRH